MIQPLERLQWSPFKTKLAVVVIFHYQHLGSTGPLQQCQTTGKAHRHAQRKLVRWSHIDQACLIWNAINTQPLLIHRHRYHFCPNRLEHCPGRRVARLFHCHAIPGSQAHPRQQIQSLLRALRNQQLIRAAWQPTAVAQIIDQPQAQTQVPLHLAIKQSLRLLIPYRPVQTAPPRLPRKLFPLGHPTRKIETPSGRAPPHRMHHPVGSRAHACR